MTATTSAGRRDVMALVPGLGLVVALGLISFWIADHLETVSSLTVGVVVGAMVTNAWTLKRPFPRSLEPGVTFAAKRLLRVGVVLLGFRLALSDIAHLGLRGVVAVALVVTGTFIGTRWLAERIGVSPKLGLLIATGYSICGASAIAAMDGVVEADEEETAYAVALVTLCGSLSIVVLPALGHLMGMSSETFGSWAGAAVHDVAQVIATAATYGDSSVEAATVVKLTRVALLAPMVALVAVSRRRQQLAAVDPHDFKHRPPLVPLFVVGFLGAVALRSTGWLSEQTLADLKTAEQWVLTFSLVGLGLGVQMASLRRLGGRPLLLGLVAWIWVAGIALVGVQVWA